MLCAVMDSRIQVITIQQCLISATDLLAPQRPTDALNFSILSLSSLLFTGYQKALWHGVTHSKCEVKFRIIGMYINLASASAFILVCEIFTQYCVNISQTRINREVYTMFGIGSSESNYIALICGSFYKGILYYD